MRLGLCLLVVVMALFYKSVYLADPDFRLAQITSYKSCPLTPSAIENEIIH